MSEELSTTDGERAFLAELDREIDQLSTYSARQIRRYRLARVVVIVSSAAVLVATAWAGAPRVLIATLGGLTLLAEGLSQLMQFQTTGTRALVAGKRLERERNLFRHRAGSYAQQRPLGYFVERVESIRATVDQEFADIWHGTAPPAVSGPPAPPAVSGPPVREPTPPVT